MYHQINTSESQWHNLIQKYFNESLSDEPVVYRDPGPYISISRQFGCMANSLARSLTKEINKKLVRQGSARRWKWINKEILIESSKALELEPNKIKYVFLSKEKTMADEILSALRHKYYKSDRKIRKTISDVIRSILSNGNVIIVGRGGVTFAADIPKSLHIKLIAPKEWRAVRISKSYNKSMEEALRYTTEVDEERQKLINGFLCKQSDDSIYDVVFNRKTMSEEDIVSIILELLDSKKLIAY